jgi:Ca2+-binding EF-hand superfamily protein
MKSACDKSQVLDFQEFQKAILRMWDVTPTTKGYRKYARVAMEWFDMLDVDNSGSITFEEFKNWYLETIREAEANGMAI